MDHEEISALAEFVKDESLKQTIQWGIGMHHAGLEESDRKLVEDLFVKKKIQILVTTSTLAWGCLLYTSPSPRDAHESRMPSSA